MFEHLAMLDFGDRAVARTTAVRTLLNQSTNQRETVIIILLYTN